MMVKFVFYRVNSGGSEGDVMQGGERERLRNQDKSLK